MEHGPINILGAHYLLVRILVAQLLARQRRRQCRSLERVVQGLCDRRLFNFRTRLFIFVNYNLIVTLFHVPRPIEIEQGGASHDKLRDLIRLHYL